MSDDLTKTGVQDRARINVKEAHEITYWTNELGVTKDRLQQLVKEVGPSAKAVREKLAEGWPIWIFSGYLWIFRGRMGRHALWAETYS